MRLFYYNFSRQEYKWTKKKRSTTTILNGVDVLFCRVFYQFLIGARDDCVIFSKVREWLSKAERRQNVSMVTTSLRTPKMIRSQAVAESITFDYDERPTLLQGFRDTPTSAKKKKGNFKDNLISR